MRRNRKNWARVVLKARLSGSFPYYPGLGQPIWTVLYDLPVESMVQSLQMPSTLTVRYMKFVIKSEYSRHDLGSLAELGVVPSLL
jgi:hypothetical protein